MHTGATTLATYANPLRAAGRATAASQPVALSSTHAQRRARAHAVQTVPVVAPAPDLLRLVLDFERRGGRGQWITTVGPWGSGAAEQVYAIERIPRRAAPTAELWTLRLEPTRATLAALGEQGIPLVLASFPEAAQAGAAALGNETPLARDVLTARGDRKHTSVIVMPANVSPYVLAHEAQHWRDFEDASFEARLNADLAPFERSPHLSESEKALLAPLVWELRGYAAQDQAVAADALADAPVLDRAGNVIIDAAARRGVYENEQADPTSTFTQTYQATILAIVGKLARHDPPALAQLAAVFAAYELPGQAGTALSFARMARLPR